MKISKNLIIQYFFIYLMLLIPGSTIFAKYLQGTSKYIILLAIYFFSMIYNKKYFKKYTVIFTVLLLFLIIFIRIKTDNGSGIRAWYQYAVCLLSASTAILVDKDKFLSRFIKAVIFFAKISLIFWVAFIVFPELVDIWPAIKYQTEIIGSQGYEKIRMGKGLILYCYMQIHSTRNCGIYTEPGVYQIILNTTLFVLLFWREKLAELSERKYRKYVITILFTLVSCQSTAGYISLAMIIGFYYFFYRNVQHKYSNRKIKTYITIAIIILMGILLMEYHINGEQSIVYKQIIDKMFAGNISDGLDLEQGSAGKRFGTIVVSLQAVMKDPFGIGYPQFESLMDAYDDRLVGASFLLFLAVYGVLPWIGLILAIFLPVFKYEKKSIAILFVMIFINATLGQTDLLYPTLMMIPMYLMFTKNMGKRYV